MSTNFGNRPAADAAQARKERTAKVGQAVGDSTKHASPKNKSVFVVDETVERAITVLYSTVIFRPNQVLDPIRGARLIELAKANHIRLRIRE